MDVYVLPVTNHYSSHRTLLFFFSLQRNLTVIKFDLFHVNCLCMEDFEKGITQSANRLAA